jgi:hypothetical protein
MKEDKRSVYIDRQISGEYNGEEKWMEKSGKKKKGT